MNRQPTRAYGLVRDKDGRPKFDNIKDIPASLWNMLTAEEQDQIRARGGNPKGELK
jgi:hypothetical protein